MWKVRKQKLYGSDLCPDELQSQSSPEGLGGAAGVPGRYVVMHVEYQLVHQVCVCCCMYMYLWV